MNDDPILDNMILELRRGALVLAVLSQLRSEQYGYSVMKLFSDRGLEIDQGTLYPLLRRLEGQGLLSSTWRVEGERPRRYYVLNTEGERVLNQLHAEWDTLVDIIQRLFEDDETKNMEVNHEPIN